MRQLRATHSAWQLEPAPARASRRIGPRNEAARLQARVCVFRCPRDAPIFSNSAPTLSVAEPWQCSREIARSQRHANCHMIPSRGVYTCEVDLGPARGGRTRTRVGGRRHGSRRTHGLWCECCCALRILLSLQEIIGLEWRGRE